MRMWGVNPKLMCDKHLLGEHVEMHMFFGCINKNKSLKGYIQKGFVEIHNISKRHSWLVKEMKNRGFNHNSYLIFTPYLREGYIDIQSNLKELARRCPKCRKKILEAI